MFATSLEGPRAHDSVLADIFASPSPSVGRSKRKSPATPRRERANLANSWDDVLASRRALKASFNNEDLNLLLDSIESTRSPATARLRLSPSPSAGRFLSPTSPSIPRKISQSLSSLPVLSQPTLFSASEPFEPAPQQREPQLPQHIAPSALVRGTPNPPPAPAGEGQQSPQDKSPRLSADPPVAAVPPVPALPPQQTVVDLSAPTPAQPLVTTVDQSGNVAGMQSVQRLEQEFLSITAPLHAASDQIPLPHQQPQYPQQQPHPGRYYAANEMGYYAEQVHLVPAPGQPMVGMHITAEGEAFNYNYAIAKAPDLCCGAGCGKCGKGYRAVTLPGTDMAHSPGSCKAGGLNCSYCSSKNFVVNEPLSKQMNRKHGHSKTYRCSVEDCDKTFITRKEQQNHIARHSCEPRFFCDYSGCNCKYTTKSSLDLHVTRIHGEKRYKCDLCEERYSVRGDLNQHMKRKHMKQRRL